MAINRFFNSSLFKLAGLFLGLLLLFASCNKKKSNLETSLPVKDSLHFFADKGILLNAIDSNNHNYNFLFETQNLKIPKEEIANIVLQRKQWQTIITFIDQSQIILPTKGDDLDFIVKKIRLNPTGHNPLSAMVEVNLPTYGRIKVTVHGKNGDRGNIIHLCQPTTPRQTVPILGLYPDYENIIDLTYTNSSGEKRGTTQIKIKTKELPVQDLPKFKVVKADYSQMEPGLNLVKYGGRNRAEGAVPFMLDAEGNIRWILFTKASTKSTPFGISAGLKRTNRGTFVAGDIKKTAIDELDLMGNLLHQWSFEESGFTFHHNLTEETDGKFFIAANNLQAQLTNGNPRIMDHIIEFDPNGESITQSWDLSTMLDTSRYLTYEGENQFYKTQTPNDWAHHNGMKEFGNNIIATTRYQGIICFSRSGKLKWIISPHKYWSNQYKPYLLSPIDESGQPITDSSIIKGDIATDGFDWPWGPHDPILLPDNKIMIFDNGFNRNWLPNSSSSSYSRAVIYQVHEKTHSIQQIWSYGKQRGASCFSPAHGSVQNLLETGNILFCPARAVPVQEGRGGRIIEVNPDTKEVIYELEIASQTDNAFQRVKRMLLYPPNL